MSGHDCMICAVFALCRFARGVAQVTEQHLRVIQLLLAAAMNNADTNAAAGGARGFGRAAGGSTAAQTAKKEQQVS